MKKMFRRKALVAFLLSIASVVLVLLAPCILRLGVADNHLKITLMIRTASDPNLMYQFYCMFLRTAIFFWPASFGEIVVILDHESIKDRRLGVSLLRQFKVYYPEYNLRVVYERQPRNEKIWNFKTSRSVGYNRQLYSTFISDQYTTNDIIVYMDADVQFRVPITQKYLMTGGKLKVLGNTPVSAPWMDSWIKTTEMATGCKTVANFMVTFPQVIYRDTITNCRKHILKHLNVSNIESAMQLFYGPDKLISPINIIMNYAWFFEKDRYDWHLAIADVEKANDNLPLKHQIQPSDTVPSIVGVPHIVDKKWDRSMMIPGYCASMAASGVGLLGCRNVSHDFNLLCHFNFEHHRFPWPGVSRWCTEGRLNPCCKKAAREHYQDVASMVECGVLKFNKEKPMLVQSLALEVGVRCEPLVLP